MSKYIKISDIPFKDLAEDHNADIKVLVAFASDIANLPTIEVSEDCISKRVISDSLIHRISELNAQGEKAIPVARELIRFKRFVDGMTPVTPTVSEDCISREFALEVISDYVNYPTEGDKTCAIKNAPSVTPTEKTGEWIPVSEPPKDGRNVFLAHGTNNFKSCCIGHYDHSMKIWYEDKNFFAKPIYDCKYWCDIPELPDMGDCQFGSCKGGDAEYERSVAQLEHDILYEPTFNPEDGSM